MLTDYMVGKQYGYKMATSNDNSDLLVQIIDVCKETALKTGDSFFLGVADYVWQQVLGTRSLEECYRMIA